MSHAINWEASTYEAEVIRQIAARAVDMAARFGVSYRHQTALMDVIACHANGNPLSLHELLAAKDADFAHDVFGIRRHINRTNGKLEDGFVPRYSLRLS